MALAALAGAKVAEADYLKTSWASLQYGLIAFIIPFLFAFNPALMALGSTGSILVAFLGTLLGCIATAAFLQGYFVRQTTLIGRALLGVAAVALFGFVVNGQFYLFLAGLVCFAVVFLTQGGMGRGGPSEDSRRGGHPDHPKLKSAFG